MKIYPGNHNIVNTQDISINHIPLSLVSGDEVSDDMDIDIKYSDYARKVPENIKVYPYQIFNSDDILLFDKDNNPVEASKFFKRDGNSFYFEPQKSLEFIPRKFTYSLLLLKNDTYKNNVDYNIKVGAYSQELAEQLIGLSKSYETPANIKINDGSTMLSSFLNISERTDFIFLDKSYIDYADQKDIEALLDSHINLWISCDEWQDLIKDDEDTKPVFLQETDGYIYPYTFFSGIDYLIDTNYEIEKFPKTEYEYINLFVDKCPILILKKEEGGFIIISKQDILDNTSINNKLAYEILLKIYLNSFYETKTNQSVIADKNIDYYIRFVKFNKNHPDINLTRLLYQDKFNMDINYDLIKVNIDDDSISYIGLDKFNNLRFKSNIEVDPEKDNNYSSVFTANDTVIYFEYDKNNLSIIEDTLNIHTQKTNDGYYLIIEPYRSSANKICADKTAKIQIIAQGTYTLYYDYAEKKFDITDNYSNNMTLLAMATVIAQPKALDFKFKDIRVLGGGESSDILNFDMIDTGSIKGRPYRLGSTLIIRLPEQYRKYKDNLMKEIKKHISSADYPILIFE